jgi:hypothetical protein
MTDQQDRERESQRSDRTKFEELADEQSAETERTAERVASDPAVEAGDAAASS